MADSGAPGAAGQGGLMSVHTDLVREHLVNGLLDAARERLAEGVPRAAAAVISSEFDSDPELALAKLGYLGRIVETERFAPARQPLPWLRKLLLGASAAGNDLAPAAALCRELAASEPRGRPDPGSGAASWRVPGPGGHVRHYLAAAAVEERLSEAAGEPPRAHETAAGPGELKRCWLFGFFLRCCEEARPAPDAR